MFSPKGGVNHIKKEKLAKCGEKAGVDRQESKGYLASFTNTKSSKSSATTSATLLGHYRVSE